MTLAIILGLGCFVAGILATLLTIIALAGPVLVENDQISDESCGPFQSRDGRPHGDQFPVFHEERL